MPLGVVKSFLGCEAHTRDECARKGGCPHPLPGAWPPRERGSATGPAASATSCPASRCARPSGREGETNARECEGRCARAPNPVATVVVARHVAGPACPEPLAACMLGECQRLRPGREQLLL